MAIESNEIITASDINTLKSKIKTMYDNRPYLTSTQKGYANTAINETTVDVATDINQIGDIVNACLVVNDISNLKFYDANNNYPNIDYLHQGDKIFADGSTTDLLDWLSDEKRDATGTTGAHGCRGFCLGTCGTGCTGVAKGTAGTDKPADGENHGSITGCKDCTGVCHTGCGGCGSGCNGNCGHGITITNTTANSQDQHCGGQCNGICSGQCAEGACFNDCTGGCGGNCGSCSTQCSNDCARTCGGGCGGTCKFYCGEGTCEGHCGANCGTTCGAGTCTGTCHNSCKSTCDDLCSGGCADTCSSTCYGTSKSL